MTMLSLWSDYATDPWFELGRSLSSFERLRREMDRLFDDSRETYGLPLESGPLGELTDTGPAYVIQADVPGLTEKELDVSANGYTVTVRGERKEEVPDGYAVHRHERGSLRFARSWQLPTQVAAGDAEAELKDGVLTLTIPKVKQAQPKRIAVQSS
jgi:HSP20 family protein